MSRSYQRLFLLLSGLLLSLPILVHISGVVPASNVSEREKRTLAQLPRFPRSIPEWRRLPIYVDRYLQDHFGLRSIMAAIDAEWHYALRSSRDFRVFINSSGRLFWRADHMLEQSAGSIRRDSEVAETVKFLVRLRDNLSKRGIRFFIAPPPNGSTIYQDQLPDWARGQGRTTEYDLLLSQLALSGITGIDLRPALLSARESGETYFRYDTHWNTRGALAAFNATVQAAGHRDWRLDPSVALGPTQPRDAGDLAAFIGMAGRLIEPVDTHDFTARKTTLSNPASSPSDGAVPPAFLLESNVAGPTIMVIGDSFTGGSFVAFLVRRAHRVIWQHHRWCNFDWTWIEQFRPDEVWWMPTERYLNCSPQPNRRVLPD